MHTAAASACYSIMRDGDRRGGTREGRRLARVLVRSARGGAHSRCRYPEALTPPTRIRIPCRRRAILAPTPARKPRLAALARHPRASLRRRLLHRPQTTCCTSLADRRVRRLPVLDVERRPRPPNVHEAVAAASPFTVNDNAPRRRRTVGLRGRLSTHACDVTRARAKPSAATFLLERDPQLRTFESFPGLRHVLRGCGARWPRAVTARPDDAIRRAGTRRA